MSSTTVTNKSILNELNLGVKTAGLDLAVMCSQDQFMMYKLNANTTFSTNLDAVLSAIIMQPYLSQLSYELLYYNNISTPAVIIANNCVANAVMPAVADEVLYVVMMNITFCESNDAACSSIIGTKSSAVIMKMTTSYTSPSNDIDSSSSATNNTVSSANVRLKKTLYWLDTDEMNTTAVITSSPACSYYASSYITIIISIII